MKKLFTTGVLLLLALIFNAYAQNDIIEELKNAYTEYLGSNNFGTEFWIANPPAYEETAGNNFVKIYVISPYETNVTVEVAGKDYKKEKKTVPNDVISFNIIPAIGQVKSKALTEPPWPEKIHSGAGIHITSDEPVAVYCILRFQATSDGYMAVPMQALGKSYIVAAYDEDPMFFSVWQDYFPSTTTITAVHDGTNVEFTLGGNNFTTTAGGMAPGDSKQITLNKGDVWMIMGDGANCDLTGSIIESDKPVAVVSGNMCTNIPVGNKWCDYTVEMQLPSEQWGDIYHVANVQKRKHPSLIRVFAKEPGTTIYRDGKEIAYIPDAGGIIGNGWQEFRVSPMGDNIDPEPAVISGDKPIGITLYNTGVEEDGYPLPDSDPFTQVQTPYKSYQNDIIFCTPKDGRDTFRINLINLVFEADKFGNVPDDLMFGKMINGVFEGVPVKEEFGDSCRNFSYDIEGKKYSVKTIEVPDEGVFRIKSNGSSKFVAYQYGYDWCDSYGYPASANFNPSEDDTDPPEMTIYRKTDNNDRMHGIMTDEDSGMSIAYLFGRESENFEFDCYQNPDDPKKIAWRLSVINFSSYAKATIVMIDRAANITIKLIEYFPD